MASFRPFFKGFKNTTSINDTPSVSSNGIVYLDENLSKEENIATISATCSGEKWKNRETETAPFRLDFIVDCQDEMYKIKANGVSFEKKYIELPTEEEIELLIQAVGRLGLEKIKQVVQ